MWTGLLVVLQGEPGYINEHDSFICDQLLQHCLNAELPFGAMPCADLLSLCAGHVPVCPNSLY